MCTRRAVLGNALYYGIILSKSLDMPKGAFLLTRIPLTCSVTDGAVFVVYLNAPVGSVRNQQVLHLQQVNCNNMSITSTSE